MPKDILQVGPLHRGWLTGKVFDVTLALDQVAEGYGTMAAA
jgi:hypothetical protein